MKKLVIGDICSHAWDLAKKHWLVFVIISVISSLISNFLAAPNQPDQTAFINNPNPQVFFDYMMDLYRLNWPTLSLSFLFSCYLAIVVFRMLVRAVRTGKPYASLVEALKVAPLRYVGYVCVVIASFIISGLGTLFCILPGIFLTVRYEFAPLIYATENVGFFEAFGRSWRMTSGHFWKLFLLGLAAFGIMILGFCACCVGIFYASVIVKFMFVLAYFELKGDDQLEDMEEVAEMVEP